MSTLEKTTRREFLGYFVVPAIIAGKAMASEPAYAERSKEQEKPQSIEEANREKATAVVKALKKKFPGHDRVYFVAEVGNGEFIGVDYWKDTALDLIQKKFKDPNPLRELVNGEDSNRYETAYGQLRNQNGQDRVYVSDLMANGLLSKLHPGADTIETTREGVTAGIRFDEGKRIKRVKNEEGRKETQMGTLEYNNEFRTASDLYQHMADNMLRAIGGGTPSIKIFTS